MIAAGPFQSFGVFILIALGIAYLMFALWKKGIGRD